jgi:hypothetical protein
MSTTIEPPELPEFATSDTYTTGTFQGQPNKDAITGTQTTDGYNPGAIPTAKVFNWLLNRVGMWLGFFRSQIGASPERYGALGDGVTDDTAALQALLDSGDKVVRLTLGKVYGISSAVEIPSDVEIYMNGAEIRLLNALPHTALTGNMFYAFGQSNIKIFGGGGKINGESLIDEGGSYFGYQLLLRDCAGVEVHDLSFHDPCALVFTQEGGGCRIIGTSYQTSFENCDFYAELQAEGNGSHGIYVALSSPELLRINRCRFGGGFRAGYTNSDGQGDIIIDDCDFRDLVVYGATLGYGLGADDARTTVRNTRFYNCQYYGAATNALAGYTFENCEFDYCGGESNTLGQAALKLSGSSDRVIGGSIKHSGMRPDGTSRAYEARAIWTATTVAGFGFGHGANITVVGTVFEHNLYSAFECESANRIHLIGCHISGSQYPISIGVQTEDKLNAVVDIESCHIRLDVSNGYAFGFTGYGGITTYDFIYRMANNTIVAAAANCRVLGASAPNMRFVYEHNQCRGDGFSFVDGCQFTYSGGNTYLATAITTPNVFEDITGNAWSVHLSTTPDDLPWVLIGANTYINVANKFGRSGGSGSVSRIKECAQITPKKRVISNTIPITGNGTWVFGDRIIGDTAVVADSAAATGSECYCSVAGNPGTWVKV